MATNPLSATQIDQLAQSVSSSQLSDTVNTLSALSGAPSINLGLQPISAILDSSSVVAATTGGGGVMPSASSRHILTGTNLTLRHFTFVFHNDLAIGGPTITTLRLNVNPEQFTMEIPYRSNAFNTLGGIFLDVWGIGVKRLVLRGQTGWRVYPNSENGASQDGFENLFGFKNDIIDAYFAAREQNESAAQSVLENAIQVILIDQLHEETYILVPEYFHLLRNRNRPLLHIYEVSFIIKDESPLTPDLFVASAESGNSLSVISGGLGSLVNSLTNTLNINTTQSGPYWQAVNGVAQVHLDFASGMQGILQSKGAIDQTAVAFRNVALQSSQALTTMMGALWAYTDLSGIDANLKYAWWNIRQMGSEFQCLLQHITSYGLNTYTGINGSTGCGALLGVPQSALENVSNTFAQLLSNQNSNSNAAVTSSVTNSGMARISSALNADIPLTMIGGGN